MVNRFYNGPRSNVPGGIPPSASFLMQIFSVLQNYVFSSARVFPQRPLPLKSLMKLLGMLLFLLLSVNSFASDGYDLWLRYQKVDNPTLCRDYQQAFGQIYFPGSDPTRVAARKELGTGLSGLTGTPPHFQKTTHTSPGLFIMLQNELDKDLLNQVQADCQGLGSEGYLLRNLEYKGRAVTLVTANQPQGLLYGVFYLLRQLQMHQPIQSLPTCSIPRIDIRMLDHWDNLDRTVERGYAGFSIWNWHLLPGYIDPRYTDYARANASIGINGTSLTNVNANADVLTAPYLEKVEALARVFRPYGIKVYLTARFSAPMEIGGLDTADPLDPVVAKWWQNKAHEIYSRIPDFGGFLVKANSEGQPGPQNYGRSHADGANMLADALAPYGGVVIWRAFVYAADDPTDRAKQAYSEFVPFDGKFRDNVLLQVKNGPIDFQPREPFHPMFGAMPHTPLVMEFQITQEYLGFATHLVFLPKLYEEVLQADTYRPGKGATVAKVIEGSMHPKSHTGMAGVANIGTARNWTGHPFGQANWYGFGRLAWDPDMSSEQIADEWLRLTFSNDPAFLKPMKKLLALSREAVVHYMTPLGLHHLFDTGHHYGPGPWVANLSRPEWNPVYYHQADTLGIGFDRTRKGSDALAQYAPEVAQKFGNLATCPEAYLLWFHHLPWDYRLKDGHTLWDGLALTYQQGVEEVTEMISAWKTMAPFVDNERFEHVEMLLDIQLREARWWRDACLLYFGQFSRMPLPEGVPAPEHSLAYYQSLKFPYAPGIRPKWN